MAVLSEPTTLAKNKMAASNFLNALSRDQLGMSDTSPKASLDTTRGNARFLEMRELKWVFEDFYWNWLEKK